MPVPNLDSMNTMSLLLFSERHENGRGYSLLFPSITKNVLNDTHYLSCYANCIAALRTCAEMHDAPQATVYKALADDFYGRLSPAARFKR